MQQYPGNILVHDIDAFGMHHLHIAYTNDIIIDHGLDAHPGDLIDSGYEMIPDIHLSERSRHRVVGEGFDRCDQFHQFILAYAFRMNIGDREDPFGECLLASFKSSTSSEDLSDS